MEDIPQLEPPPATERLAYSIQECADMLLNLPGKFNG
jgi:hypothetical protein